MSQFSVCPLCGRPSAAKVACGDCRAKFRANGCSVCGAALSGRKRTCSSCVYRAKVPSECSVCGRSSRVVARGLCGSCYSAEYRVKHGRKPARYRITCSGCGNDAVVSASSSTYCTFECWNRYANGRGKVVAVWVRPRSWVGHVVPSKGGGFVAGQCSYCPEFFVGRAGSVYCSSRCSVNASWQRRFGRIGDFLVTPRVRAEIYARDGHICQLCFDPVDLDVPTQDRMGHTLDHIIPQSVSVVPDHSPSNLRLAHRICNSLRGDGTREAGYGSTIDTLPELGCLQAAFA